jgi:pyridoxine/pyridoxamine 5'-phosphate oxidase
MENNYLHFLQSNPVKLCVFATASDVNQPWCAVMGYAAMDDFTIILSTHEGTRKWRNLMQNQKVALVFGWEFKGFNIQCEGVAEVIDGIKESYNECADFFFTQNPQAAKFRSPTSIFIKIKPTWMRVTNFDHQPPSIWESDIKVQEGVTEKI